MAGTLMGKAALPLSYITALKRHAWLASSTFVSVLIGVTAISLAISPRLYETSARLMVGQKEVGLSALGQELSNINNQSPSKAADPVATQAELVQSQQILRGALKRALSEGKIPIEKLPTLEELKTGIKVEIVPATSILEISYTHSDPKIAADLLNQIAKLVIAENTKLIRAEATSLRNFLEEQIPEQKQRLQKAEQAERRYRETYSFVASNIQTEGLIESLSSLENQERQLRAQLQEARKQESSLQQVVGANTPTGAYIVNRIGQDEQIKELNKQITATEVAIASARTRWTDQHPEVLALAQKRDELRSLYNQQISQIIPANQTVDSNDIAANQLSQDLISRYILVESERKGLEDKLKVVQRDIEGLRSRVAKIPYSQQSLVALTREREKAEKALKTLDDKLEEARITEGQILSNIRIVGEAEIPLAPVSPKPLVIFVLSTVVGIIAAGLLVLLLELMQSKLRDAEEVEAWLDTPVLGVLPKLNPKTFNLAALDSLLDNPEYVEPYRMLLKTLESLGKEQSKIIIVSSVAFGEGKSSVALHLAAVAGILSRRTLIVSADLQHPVYHNLLNVPAYPGLTEVVTDNLPLLDLVQPTSIPNLSVLPSGRIPSRPSTIIEKMSMDRILEEAAQHYDYVIVDASPISSNADAATLSQSADGVILVVKPNSTSKDAAFRAISNLQKSGSTLLGVVINETVLPVEKELAVLTPVDEHQQLPPAKSFFSGSIVKNTSNSIH
ncbi:polysaccharide biosynthesis tyrosine autokinase [Tolypothrix sp. FACHB-123]|uniref:GumC family protein n=1 Tax=Tolypothrix sp. FACHB-123 TaxID=2692868 RepID=UPI00168918D8|nr:polysaccharide biosynthesis tyrosine autokinase [Tolypothrix sp. FACHB-123]MBD2359258.1 polysaccharide biosynthesis tyrosine autokinase [Tolypothrix sp. FACHB-123]